MSMSIHIEDDLYQQAKLVSKGEHRTISEQVAHWAKLGMAASEGSPLMPTPRLPKPFKMHMLELTPNLLATSPNSWQT